MYTTVFFQFVRCVALAVLWCVALPTLAQENVSDCSTRSTQSLDFYIRIDFCLETVLVDDSAGELGFTALAIGEDGTLYVTRPLLGQVLALTDANGDGLPESPRLLIEGLDTPNALTFYDGTLYIVAGASVLAWRDGQTETLIDDLPRSGIWHGGILAHEGTLYIGISAACGTCDNPERGLILAYDLRDSTRRVFARGFRQPYALGVFRGDVWAGDIAPRDTLGEMGLDELNRLKEGGDYGFPRCVGVTGDCAGTIAPVYRLPAQVQPFALFEYTGVAFPQWQGTFLVLMGGTPTTSLPLGFQIVAIREQADAPPVFHSLAPASDEVWIVNDARYQDDIGWTHRDGRTMSLQGVGLYPHHPYSLIQSPEGWLYLSVGGGAIYALRPPSSLR